jgi:GPCR-chaperone
MLKTPLIICLFCKAKWLLHSESCFLFVLIVSLFAEIPLFHVLNAKITFGNIFASETPVPGANCVRDGERMHCVVDDNVFMSPSTYSVIGIVFFIPSV